MGVDSRRKMGNPVVGIIGVAVAATFWGSNFIVCKGYNLPEDGFHFVLLMATGILLVGLCALFSSKWVSEESDFEVVFSPDGLLGGFIWSLGNFMTVPIVKHIGLAMGLAIWAGFNLIVAFVVGAVGMGSLLKKEEIAHMWMGALGIVVAVVALVLFSLVKPTLEDDDKKSVLHSGSFTGAVNSGSFCDDKDDAEALDDPLFEGLKEQNTSEPEPIVGEQNTNKMLGIAMAAMAGTLYGFQFVPLQVWNDRIDDQGTIFGYPEPSDTVKALRFLFSQFAGIFLSALCGFVCYCAYTGNKPKVVPPEAILPSICSGVVWAIGGAGGILATSGLGNAVGFPLVLNLSFIVNSSWSILYFKEIQGKRNLQLFGCAFVLNIASSVLISLSKN